jgi:hypothetical protein
VPVFWLLPSYLLLECSDAHHTPATPSPFLLFFAAVSFHAGLQLPKA